MTSLRQITVGVLLATSVAIVSFVFLSTGDDSYLWRLPRNIPAPMVPADNPISVSKVELGRWLFYDQRLSVNNAFSCGSCHLQHLAFTDGRPRAVGTTGEIHPRGAMSLVNVAYASRLTWANHLLDRLEIQALTPLFGEQPVEMGMAGHEERLLQTLREDALYSDMFPRVFPGDGDPYSILNVVRALATFVRSIVSFDSPYDRYLRGDTTALVASQMRGMDLFFSERLECFHCHGGFNFTDSSTHINAVVDNVGFHNTGLYNVDGNGAYPTDNTGLYDLTGERRDMGRFRAPTLRNIELTAPYMHDGSIESLEEVIDHYAIGGRVIEEGVHAGEGFRSPFKSEFLRGFELTDAERQDLLAFLQSLTDPGIAVNPAWADPFLGRLKDSADPLN